MLTTEELLARAQKPSEDAMKLHPFYKGKIEVIAKCVIRDSRCTPFLRGAPHFLDTFDL